MFITKTAIKAGGMMLIVNLLAKTACAMTRVSISDFSTSDFLLSKSSFLSCSLGCQDDSKSLYRAMKKITLVLIYLSTGSLFLGQGIALATYLQN